MQIVKSIAEMQNLCRQLRTRGTPLGFVPTMGALHDGHLSLMRRARTECEVIIASIFVNPLQFAPGEDLAPEAGEMYPSGSKTTITVSQIGDRLDGASRPGHFTGVATVVAKLFHVVGPTRAYFGEKDAAQLAVLRQMVRDLNFDIELVGCAIVRNTDGLALSSRNRYLSAIERENALVLHRALLRMERMIAEGERQSTTLIRGGMEILYATTGIRVDYLAIVDANTLLPVTSVETGTLVAIAAYVGNTRLIDNFLVA